MESINKLSTEEFRARVLRARSMTPDEKLQECSRLTELAIEAMKAEIRADLPQAPESEVEQILTLRLEILRIAKGKLPGGICLYPRSPTQRSADQTEGF